MTTLAEPPQTREEANEFDEDADDTSASGTGLRAEDEDAGLQVGLVDGKSLEELAVRFSQATKELQASHQCIMLLAAR